ncbi:MAG: CBS domain-containing protein [Acidimicrobiales bacterium]
MPLSLQDKIESLDYSKAVFVQPDETLRAVAHALWVENVGALVVGDPHHPMGIVSERDVVSQMAQGAAVDVVTAGETMTSYLVAARTGDTLDDGAYQMLDRGIRHLPVIDGEGRVVGMVSVRDLLRPLLSGGPDGRE